MPRKKTPYTPIMEVFPDGSTVINTGIYVASLGPPLKTVEEFEELMRQHTEVPPPTPAEVMADMERTAREWLQPHIFPTPLDRDEVLAIKERSGNSVPGTFPGWEMVADFVNGEFVFYKVKPESRRLPIIRRASDVLQYVRRIRKAGRERFLAGVELGRRYERMIVGQLEPNYIGASLGVKKKRMAGEQRRQSNAERNAKIVSEVNSLVRSGKKREVAYRTVGNRLGLGERQVANIVRQRKPKKS